MIPTLRFENRVVQWCDKMRAGKWGRKHHHFSVTAALMGFSGGPQGARGDGGVAHRQHPECGRAQNYNQEFISKYKLSKIILKLPFLSPS